MGSAISEIILLINEDERPFWSVLDLLCISLVESSSSEREIGLLEELKEQSNFLQ